MMSQKLKFLFVSEKSEKLTKTVINAMKHRSTLHTNQQRTNDGPIYDTTDNLRQNVSKARKSDYDNGGFDSD